MSTAINWARRWPILTFLTLCSTTAANQVPPLVSISGSLRNDSSYHVQCTAQGNPSPHVTLYLDGKIQSRGWLILQEPSLQEAHTLHCLAQNDYGVARSDTLQSPVLCQDPQRPTSLETEVSVQHGGSLLLPCDHVTCSNKIEWNIDEAHITSNGSLVVSNVTESRTFQCKFYDNPLWILGRKWNVSPRIHQEHAEYWPANEIREEKGVLQGKAVELLCIHHRSILWQTAAGNVSTFPLLHLVADRSETYTCKDSQFGQAIKTVVISVYDNLQKEVNMMQDQLEVSFEDNVTFHCGEHSSDTTTEWFYNNVQLKGAIPGLVYSILGGHTLILLNFSKVDGAWPTGVVQCNTSNPVSYTWQTARFSVAGTKLPVSTKRTTKGTSTPFPSSFTAYFLLTSQTQSRSPIKVSPFIVTGPPADVFDDSFKLVYIYIIVSVAAIISIILVVIGACVWRKNQTYKELMRTQLAQTYDVLPVHLRARSYGCNSHCSHACSRTAECSPLYAQPYDAPRRQPPASLPASDSGYDISERGSAKEQHLHRYLADVHYDTARRQRTAPAASATPVAAHHTPYHHCPSAPSIYNNPVPCQCYRDKEVMRSVPLHQHYPVAEEVPLYTADSDCQYDRRTQRLYSVSEPGCVEANSVSEETKL